MTTFLSPDMWLIFTGRLLDSIYPAEFVFLAFMVLSIYLSLSKKSKLKFFHNLIIPINSNKNGTLQFHIRNIFSNRIFFFLLTFIFCDLAVRTLIFFAGVPFSGRYFIPFSISFTIISTAGIFPLSEFISKLAQYCKFELPPWKALFFILLIIFSAYSTKALLPHFDKQYLKVFGSAIKQNSMNSSNVIILTNNLDERVGYYSGTENFLSFNINNHKWILRKKIKNKNAYKWKIANNAENCQQFISILKNELHSKIIKSENLKLFVIIRTYKNKKLNQKLTNFEKQPQMHKIKALPTTKNRVIKLYEYDLAHNNTH